MKEQLKQWKTKKVGNKNTKRGKIVDRGKTSTKGRLNLCTRERRFESRNNTIIPQHLSRRVWRKIENNRIGGKKLLVAGNNISTDFITKLLLVQGYNAILVVCNQFTKMAHFIATTEKTLAERLARLF